MCGGHDFYINNNSNHQWLQCKHCCVIYYLQQVVWKCLIKIFLLALRSARGLDLPPQPWNFARQLLTALKKLWSYIYGDTVYQWEFQATLKQFIKHIKLFSAAAHNYKSHMARLHFSVHWGGNKSLVWLHSCLFFRSSLLDWRHE